MCTYGVSSLTNYLNPREQTVSAANWWNYPPPSLSPSSSSPSSPPSYNHISPTAITTMADNKAVAPTLHHVLASHLASASAIQKQKYQPFDDYLGLSGMLANLGVADPIHTLSANPTSLASMANAGGHRARLGSDGAEVLLDDFRANGVDTELDELDRIKMRARPRSPPPSTPVNLSPVSVSPPSSASPPATHTVTLTAEQLRMLELLQEERKIHEEKEMLRAAAKQRQIMAAVMPVPPPPTVTAVPVPIPAAAVPLSSRVAATTGVTSSRRARHGSGGSGGSNGQQPVCVFCRNNGEPVHVYTAHFLKDSTGRVTCPILRAYKCPYCRASGDNAHTKTYCPLAISALGEAPLSAERVLSKSSTRSSAGKKNRQQQMAAGGGVIGRGMMLSSSPPGLNTMPVTSTTASLVSAAAAAGVPLQVYNVD